MIATEEVEDSIATAPPVIAIGASAGGLDPFERFFSAMPVDTGYAIVVVQHLSPDFRSLMDELLERRTSMKIHRAEDGMVLEPNVIYLNPPRPTMTISEGRISLADRAPHESLNLPIDQFFESLATDCGNDAIAVVLSGTGSDGTRGCQAIKDAGGRVFVQLPESAKFDGMPSSVINAGLSDGTADPEDLPELILAHINGEAEATSLREADFPDEPMEQILQIVFDRYGADFRCYKTSTVERRVDRRVDIIGEASLADYAVHLAADPEEIQALYNDLLIEVTAFFRDAKAFKVLEDEVIPAIVEPMAAHRQVRIWVPGCASGEEAYSIAMLVDEYAERKGIEPNVRILATDLHDRSLTAASAGIYSQASVKALSAERLSRYFEKHNAYYHVKPELRKYVVFTPHNVLRDPPFTRMDLVSCRNMLIYFNDKAQQKVISLFHFALAKDGFLFLGPSETVGHLSAEFQTINQRWRLFQKIRDVRLLESSHILNSPTPLEKDRATRGWAPRDLRGRYNDQRRAITDAMHSLVAKYAPTGFLVSQTGELVHVFGDAGRFLTVVEGGFSSRISDLVRPELQIALSTGIERFKRTQSIPFRRGVEISESDGTSIHVTLAIESLTEGSGDGDFMLITLEEKHIPGDKPTIPDAELFAASDAASFLQLRNDELEQDLRSTEENLQTTIEELETSNEELQATNEELMASNEELQSTNEELHSVNEELFTVSAEHQRKIEELTELTNDMDHLLKSTEIGTIFLDADLCIRRFTPATARTFNILSHDIGRPVEHITTRFDQDGLMDLVSAVRDDGTIREREVEAGDRTYLLRLLPYAASKAALRGVVITVIDVSEQKAARQQIDELAAYHRSILADVPDFIVRWSADKGKVTFANDIFGDFHQTSGAAIVGMAVKDLFGQKHMKELESHLANLDEGTPQQIRLMSPGDGHYPLILECQVRPIHDASGTVVEVQATGHDATAEIRYLETLEKLIHVADSADTDYLERITSLLEAGRAYLGVDYAIVWRVSGDAELKVEASDGAVPGRSDPGATVKRATSLAGLVAAGDEPFVLDGQLRAAHFDRLERYDRPVKAYIGVPITLHGRTIGAVEFCSTDSRPDADFTARELGFTRLFARWIAYKMERRDQLLALRRSERKLKRIFDSVPSRIWYKDDKNRILGLNDTAAKSMGVTVAQAEGADSHDLFPEMAEQYYEDDLKVLRSQKPKLGIIEEFIPKDGERGWSQTDKIPFDDPETAERNILVVSTDITELKRRESQLADLNDALEIQQREYLKLYRSTPVMMQSIGQDGEILEVSDTWLEHSGYDRDEVIGCRSTDFLTRQSRSFAKETALPNLWQNGACLAVPLQFIRKDGAILDIEMSGVVDTSETASKRALGVLIDVTERNLALAEIEARNSELAQANDGLEQFAYVASHDLQEPLRKIRQFSELLLNDYREELDEDGQYFIDVITKSAARMSQLVRDVLIYSRSSNQSINAETINLHAIVEEAIADLDYQIEQAGASVRNNVRHEIEGDPTMVRQILANLLSNAVKYGAPDRKTNVTIATRQGKRSLTLEVKDNGIGFSDEFSESIFSPFVRLHTKHDYEGSGVGLAICKTMCERHGWRMTAKSTLGKGSIFRILIPMS